MQYTRIVSVALIVFAVVGTMSAQAPPPRSCDPIGGVRFVCGQSGPEDLVVVPRTHWLVASALAGEGGIYLIDTRQGSSTRIFPNDKATDRLDRNTYGACPGPPAGDERSTFRTHGLYLKAGRRSRHTLYAVHHGGRESIEVFEFLPMPGM